MYASQMDPMGLISQIEIVPISQFKIYRSHGMGKSAYGFQTLAWMDVPFTNPPTWGGKVVVPTCVQLVVF